MKTKKNLIVWYNVIGEHETEYYKGDGHITMRGYSSKVTLLGILLDLKFDDGCIYGNFDLKSFKFKTDK